MANGQTWRKRLLPIAAMTLTTIIVTGIIVICWWHSTTVVLVIRHAETSSAVCEPEEVNRQRNTALVFTEPMSPRPVSPRAQALRHTCEKAGIGAIYASELCRTQETVRPLSERLSIPFTEIPQHTAEGIVNVDALIARINDEHTGQVVLIAGHSHTIPTIIEKLGGGDIGSIDGSEFDNLFVVTITRYLLLGNRAKVVRLQYGAPSP